MRLDKILAHSGYGTRKEVKELIRKGFVLVNGEQISDDDYKVDEINDEITVAEETLDYQTDVYLMLNKPAGYVSATYDPKEPTVLDLLNGYENRKIFPVGRLDKDTEGLLLISNDGVLSHNLLSPKHHVDKKYYLRYNGQLPADYRDRFAQGIILDDDYKCLPAEIILLQPHQAYIIIKEGKYHQIKRMMKSLGCDVTYLKRVAFGPLPLDDNLKLGEYRKLTEQEILMLKKQNS